MKKRSPPVAADTHVEVPDYLDPRRKIKVPRTELCEPLDDQFYALHLGRATSGREPVDQFKEIAMDSLPLLSQVDGAYAQNVPWHLIRVV